MAYDFDEFLNKVKDMGLWEIISYGNQEGVTADRASHGRGGRLARDAGSLEYVRQIGKFLFFLQNGQRAGSMSDEEFEKYKVVIEAIVKKGELEPEILDAFE